MEIEAIEMLEINDRYFPSKSGIYLVRTLSTYGKYFISISYPSARVKITTKYAGEFHYEESYSIDVHNQLVTHISKYPINE